MFLLALPFFKIIVINMGIDRKKLINITGLICNAPGILSHLVRRSLY